jgi:hypothetical protein
VKDVVMIFACALSCVVLWYRLHGLDGFLGPRNEDHDGGRRNTMEQLWWVFLVACLYLAIGGSAGGYQATQKRREVIEGILVGLFFGPFGLIVEACLPEGREPTRNEAGTIPAAMEEKRAREALSRMTPPR